MVHTVSCVFNRLASPRTRHHDYLERLDHTHHPLAPAWRSDAELETPPAPASTPDAHTHKPDLSSLLRTHLSSSHSCYVGAGFHTSHTVLSCTHASLRLQERGSVDLSDQCTHTRLSQAPPPPHRLAMCAESVCAR